MNTTKFTPGPWRIKSTGVIVQDNGGIGGTIIAEAITDSDARLIAQAPAMYAALKDVLEAHQQSKLMPLHFDAVRQVLSATEK